MGNLRVSSALAFYSVWIITSVSGVWENAQGLLNVDFELLVHSLSFRHQYSITIYVLWLCMFFVEFLKYLITWIILFKWLMPSPTLHTKNQHGVVSFFTWLQSVFLWWFDIRDSVLQHLLLIHVISQNKCTVNWNEDPITDLLLYYLMYTKTMCHIPKV